MTNPLDLIKPIQLTSIWEKQAHLYMQGLRSQNNELQQKLKENEELLMCCWYAEEELRVLTISMASDNVVALNCIDSDGATVQVTGHMTALAFSFRVRTIAPPAVRKSIGFTMQTTEQAGGKR
ncbi:MAG: hypothetical protein ACLQMO_00560 [Acidobacteriaceae bacterium]